MRSCDSRATCGFLHAISKYCAKVPSHASSRSRSRYSSNRFTRSMWFTLSLLYDSVVYDKVYKKGMKAMALSNFDTTILFTLQSDSQENALRNLGRDVLWLWIEFSSALSAQL